jgi:hypothetical protein
VNSRVGEGTELSISIPLADAARAWINADMNGSASANQNGAAAQPQPVAAPVNSHNDTASTTILDPSPTVQLGAAADSMRGRQ